MTGALNYQGVGALISGLVATAIAVLTFVRQRKTAHAAAEAVAESERSKARGDMYAQLKAEVDRQTAARKEDWEQFQAAREQDQQLQALNLKQSIEIERIRGHELYEGLKHRLTVEMDELHKQNRKCESDLALVQQQMTTLTDRLATKVEEGAATGLRIEEGAATVASDLASAQGRAAAVEGEAGAAADAAVQPPEVEP